MSNATRRPFISAKVLRSTPHVVHFCYKVLQSDFPLYSVANRMRESDEGAGEKAYRREFSLPLTQTQVAFKPVLFVDILRLRDHDNVNLMQKKSKC